MKEPHFLNEASFTEKSISNSPSCKDTQFSTKESPLVSYYQNVLDQNPSKISIYEALNIIKSGKLKPTISKLRSHTGKNERDNFKKKLPSITVSGIFKDGHKSVNLVQHSGLIQIDIDSVMSPIEIIQQLKNDVFVFSCFISPSGNGVKAIVKISINKHLESFEFLERYFLKRYKIEIDSKCKDVGRLMFLSHDENIFINDNSLEFNSQNNDIIHIMNQLENRKFDITKSYEDWLSIGFSFADHFGESGRNLFQKLSCYHIDYDKKKCDEQFTKCLNAKGKGATLKSFFSIAKKAGLEIFFENNSKIEIVKKKEEKALINEPVKTSQFIIVENYLQSKYDFRLNIVSNEIEIKEKTSIIFEAINENNIYRLLQHQNIHFSQSKLTALLRSDFVPQYDPLKYYFESLPQWDEQTDHIDNLCRFIKAKDQKRFNIQFKKMLVRTVSCALGRSFNKQAFIFIGGQNGGKTTFCRWLCPEKLKDYYAENISTDKDGLISLAENWLINLDELASLQKFEINQLKSMISKDSIKVRRPYDKKPVTTKRRASFFGSTNKEEFLTDETGTVRWLCFELDGINFNYNKELDINLIWSQAYFLLNNGFKVELSTEEILENEHVNAGFQVRTSEIDLLQTYFEPSEKGKLLGEPLTATDIINRLKGAGLAQVNLNIASMGKALKLLGYRQVSERIEGNKFPTKVYWVRFNVPL